MESPRIDTAIVLAGGLGTRLRAAVPDLPKPLAPVAGRPFLEHLLDYWIAQGIRRFVLSVGYKAAAIRAALGDRYRGAPITYAEESTPLGTGGGLLLAARGLGDARAPLLVCNGDTWFAVPLAGLADTHRRQAADWTFALFRTREKGRYLGMTIAADGTIPALGTRAGDGDGGSDGEHLANGGVYLVSPDALRRLAAARAVDAPASLENDLLPALLAAGGRLCGFPCDGTFIDIGLPEDYRRAAGMLQPPENRS